MPQQARPDAQAVMKAFSDCDVNGDGELSFNEL